MDKGERSRRQRLLEYAETGRLRDALSGTGGPEQDVIDLIVDVCIRYCEPRRIPAWKRRAVP